MPEQEAREAFATMLRECPEFAQMLRDLQPTAQELFPNEPAVHDWTYRDLPGRLSPEMWDRLMSIIGDSNCRVIAISESWKGEGEKRELQWKRGQLLISPAGMGNLRQHSAKRQESPNA